MGCPYSCIATGWFMVVSWLVSPPRPAHLHMPQWQERWAMANQDWCTTRIMCLANPGSVFHLTNDWRSTPCGNITYQGMHRAKHTTCQRWQGYPLTNYTLCRWWGNPSLRTLDAIVKIITIVFEETHKWLANRGLKTDQVKNELMHFTKTKNQTNNPSIHIPSNNPDTHKEVTSASCMRYLGLWFDPQLRFHEHTKITASKASRATEALHMLGNSTSGINQLCLRQLYLGMILPIMTYGSIAFWNGKSPALKSTLECAQNKVLHFITGAFRTMPTTALEVEALIPPIDITLDYYTTHFVTCTNRLDPSDPIMCWIPEQYRDNVLTTSTPHYHISPHPQGMLWHPT